jgi:hypothetical protein
MIVSRGADFNSSKNRCVALYEGYDRYQCSLIVVKAGVHKFTKLLGATSKLQVPEG